MKLDVGTSILAPRYIGAEMSQGVDIKQERMALEKCAVASTQKLLTAMVIAKLQCWEETVKIEAIDQSLLPLDRLPVVAGLQANEKFTVIELLHMMLIGSANDAAMALARFVAGDSKRFSVLMNEEAQALGMQRSEFANPHGLPYEAQHSCALDLLTLAVAVLKEKRLAEMLKLKNWQYDRRGQTINITNTNRLLWEVPRCIGMKTGFSLAAGNCLMTTVQLEERTWVGVVLGSNREHIWTDSKNLISLLI